MEELSVAVAVGLSLQGFDFVVAVGTAIVLAVLLQMERDAAVGGGRPEAMLLAKAKLARE